jgi:hypothetical protein
MERAVHPDGSQVVIDQRGVLKRHFVLNNCTISILNAQINVVI